MAYKRICGIYCIENLINGNKYIGQSVSIKQRWENHRLLLNRNEHRNIHLQRAWNKYKYENFNFYIIEICEADMLDEREKYYIDLYDTFKNGYNRDTGGNLDKKVCEETKKMISDSWIEITEERRINMRYAQKSKPIYQIDFNGNIINSWYGGREASKKLNLDFSTIWTCLNSESKTYKNFIWVYQDKYINDFDLYKYLHHANKPRIVNQYDLNNNFIKQWSSANSAICEGFDTSTIIKCCKGKKKTHKNYIWKYANNEELDFSSNSFAM